MSCSCLYDTTCVLDVMSFVRFFDIYNLFITVAFGFASTLFSVSHTWCCNYSYMKMYSLQS